MVSEISHEGLLLSGFSTASIGTTPERTTPHPATTEEDKTPANPPAPSVPMIAINFLVVSGQQTLTTLGTMTTYGEVTLEPVANGFVLVLDGPGEYVDMGTPLPCLRDVTSCQDGFSLRITFELLTVSCVRGTCTG